MPWPTRSEFDYIVIGAGTAGCVLAARLSQDRGTRVLLLEAGEPIRTPAITVPSAWPVLIGGAVDWGSFTTAQADAGILPYPRGRLLGGSGEINAMAHQRGHPAVYDAWASAGAVGWAHADLLPYLRRTEHAADRHPQLRGAGGPVRVAPIPEADRHPAACAFAEALDAMGFPVSDDLSGGQHEGVGWPDLAIDSGQRTSPAGAYLRPVLHRPNLIVETGCQVTRLLIQHNRCTGVSYLRHGAMEVAHAASEVIVCAGAVGSPQMFLLSGIGPASHLKSVGIDPVADLPGVGANLQDHPVAMACYQPEAPLPPSRYNHGETCAALRSVLASGWPDLQLSPILLPLAPCGYRTLPGGFALIASATAPDSRGTVRLISDDPLAAPLIDPGLLRDERDLDRLQVGLEIVRHASKGTAFTRLRVTETWPGVIVRDSGILRRYIRRTVASCYHPAGTCRMGPDADAQAVTDPQLRVRGITGLRIADASVIPLIPNAPLNATVMAIAEKAADLITGRCLPPGYPLARQ